MTLLVGLWVLMILRKHYSWYHYFFALRSLLFLLDILPPRHKSSHHHHSSHHGFPPWFLFYLFWPGISKHRDPDFGEKLSCVTFKLFLSIKLNNINYNFCIISENLPILLQSGLLVTSSQTISFFT